MDQTIPRCYYRISLKALIRNEDKTKFLIALEHNGQWDFLWWWLDHGEDPIECIHRELQEEIGWDIKSINKHPFVLLTVKCLNWPHKDKPIANIFYEATVENTEMKNSDECVEVRFVTTQEALQLPDRTGMIHTFANYVLRNKI